LLVKWEQESVRAIRALSELRARVKITPALAAHSSDIWWRLAASRGTPTMARKGGQDAILGDPSH
jgi:hypothetical protein